MRRLATLLFLVLLSGTLVACEGLGDNAGFDNADGGINLDLDATGGDGSGLVQVACTGHADCAGVAVAGGCQLGMCDTDEGVCITTNMPDGQECSTAGPCLMGGACLDGACEGGEPVEDGLSCETEDACGRPGVCTVGACEADEDVPACDDGNPCTVDVCVEAEGGCFYQFDDGAGCEDGDPCTVEDSCDAGVCHGDPTPDCEGGVCGDGECGEEEDSESCPQDCGDGPDPLGCLEEKCGGPWLQCFENEACAEILICLDECGDDDVCRDVCVDEADPAAMGDFWVLISCGQESGCLGPEPGECGDGACGPGENPQSCPEDCEGGGDPVPCLTEFCEGEFYGCFQDEGCAAIVSCLEGCQTPGCQEQCIASAPQDALGTFMELVECGENHGCFDGGGDAVCGNDICDLGEDGFNCPEDCKGPGGKCGDGKCDGPENPGNCPEDCGDDPVLDCVLENCETSYYKCLSNPGCEEILICLGDCGPGDQQCEEGCLQGAAPGAWGDFYTLAECAQANGCLEGGGDPEIWCGDGECNGDENPDSCPDDCQGGGEADCGNGICEGYEEFYCEEDCKKDSCGNGQCEADMGEDPDTCPEDCQGSGGGDFKCGDGICEGFEEWYCAEDCSCGNGECEPDYDENHQTCPEDCKD